MNNDGKLFDKLHQNIILPETTEDNVLSKIEGINLETRLRGIEYAIDFLGQIVRPLYREMILYNKKNTAFNSLGESEHTNSSRTFLKLTNGIIIQRGVYDYTATDETWKTVTFPKEFSSDNYTVVASPQSRYVTYVAAAPNLRSNFLLAAKSATKIHWIAFGY